MDDEPAIVRIVQFSMARLGHEIRTASFGEEAIEQAAQFKPQLAIVDVRMPGMDGMELCRRLKADHPDLYVIFLTAWKEERHGEYADAGADAVVIKPCSLREILDAVKVAEGRAT